MEPAVAFAGGDAQQAAFGIEFVDQRGDACIQRFAQRAREAELAVTRLIGLDHGMAFVVGGIGGKLAQRKGQAQPDDPANLVAFGRGQAGVAEGQFHRLADRRLPIDQRAVAIEDDQPAHLRGPFGLPFAIAPRARRGERCDLR